MPSNYYQTSVELGQQYQINNPKNWNGHDAKNYHMQIAYLMEKYQAKVVLDYGCGKGLQYKEAVPYPLADGTKTLPMNFRKRIGASKVVLYDPCVEEYSNLPDPETKFDAVICTQVLGSIPDSDIDWVRDLIANYATKFVFIGLFDPTTTHVKAKKRMYDPNHLTYNRTVEWYLEKFKDWSGPDLYWWFRDSTHSINSWYPLNKIGQKFSID